MSVLVDHEKLGKVLVIDGYYYQLPIFFETISQFLQSEYNTAFVPIFLSEIKPIKRRQKAIIISGITTYELFNVERIDNVWERNNFEGNNIKSGYLAELVKNKMSDNGFLIKSLRPLKRNPQQK